MSTAFDIAVVGSVNLDFVVRTQSLPRAGQTVGGGYFFTSPGGKGANQALAAQRLGAKTQLIAAIGADRYADEALVNLRNDGVDLSRVSRIHDEMTGAAFINVDDRGENQIAVASGANGALCVDNDRAINAAWVIAQLEVTPETILAAVENSNARFCLNAAPACPVSQDLLDRADLLVLNEGEWHFFKDKLSTFRGDIVITLGAKGAVAWRNGKEGTRVAAPLVDVVDTTGAGDTFVSGLVVALFRGCEIDDALRWACHCGALSTTKLGAQTGMPWGKDLVF